MTDRWPFTLTLRPGRRSTGLSADGRRCRDEILAILREASEPLTTRQVWDAMTRGLGGRDAHLSALHRQGFVTLAWSKENRPVRLWSLAEDCPTCGRPLKEDTVDE